MEFRALKYKIYIGSARERDDYRGVVFAILIIPWMLSYAASHLEGLEHIIWVVVFLVWLVLLRKNWETLFRHFHESHKKKRYLLISALLVLMSPIQYFSNNIFLLVLAAIFIWLWTMFEVDVLFGEEPEIIEDET